MRFSFHRHLKKEVLQTGASKQSGAHFQHHLLQIQIYLLNQIFLKKLFTFSILKRKRWSECGEVAVWTLCHHISKEGEARLRLQNGTIHFLSSPPFLPLVRLSFLIFLSTVLQHISYGWKKKGERKENGRGGGAVAITGMYPSVRGLPNLGAENTPPTPPPKINLQHFLDPFGCLSHKVWSIPRTGREIHSGSYDNSTTAWRFALWDSKVCILSPTADRQEIFQIVRFNHLFTFKYVN